MVGVPEPSVDMGMLIVLPPPYLRDPVFGLMVGVPEPSVDMGMLIVLPPPYFRELVFGLMVGVPEPSVGMDMLIVLPTLSERASLWSHGGRAWTFCGYGHVNSSPQSEFSPCCGRFPLSPSVLCSISLQDIKSTCHQCSTTGIRNGHVTWQACATTACSECTR